MERIYQAMGISKEIYDLMTARRMIAEWHVEYRRMLNEAQDIDTFYDVLEMLEKFPDIFANMTGVYHH